MKCCNPKYITIQLQSGGLVRQIVPCCKCYACEQKLRSEWTYRIQQECFGKFVIFLTFTYDDDFLPTYVSDSSEVLQRERCKPIKQRNYDISYLEKSHFTQIHRDINKLWRKFLNDKKAPLIRYVINGEYGDHSHRAHGHGIFIFPSIVSHEICAEFCKVCLGFLHDYRPGLGHKQKENFDVQCMPKIYNSKIWQYGLVTGQYVYDTAQGVAHYVSKHATKSCKGSRRQQELSPIFRLQSVHGGGIGINEIMMQPDLRQRYENRQGLKSTGSDGKQYTISIPRAVTRRLHPSNFDDNELIEKALISQRCEDDFVGLLSFSEDFQKYGNDISKHSDYLSDERKRSIYRALQIQDKNMRISMEERRLSKKK